MKLRNYSPLRRRLVDIFFSSSIFSSSTVEDEEERCVPRSLDAGVIRAPLRREKHTQARRIHTVLYLALTL